MAKITVAGVEYPSKAAVADRCKELLRTNEPGEPLDGAAHAFLLGLLALHPDAARKVGPGVARFYTVQNRFSRCFYVRRTDSTEEDFSYTKCLK
jgi:hypothetical protein